VKTKKEKFKHIFNLTPEQGLSKEDKAKLFERIVRSTAKRRTRRLLFYIGPLAAVACLLVCFKLFFPRDAAMEPKLDIERIASISQTLNTHKDSLQLISVDPHTESHAISFLNVKGSSDILDLMGPEPKAATPQYHTLFVPYGKRQEFTLPDHSKVWLNAGSYLTYTPDMLGKPREVYLNGEGYFDVAHTGTTFIVRTKNASVKVLGTSFNLSSYEEDKKMAIELITGKVELSSPHFKDITMVPGQLITYDLQRQKVIVDSKAEGNEILWTKKQLVLDRLSTKDLIKKLERIYNVRIHADPSVLENATVYSGRINLDVDILTSLSTIYALRNYRITQVEKEVWINNN